MAEIDTQDEAGADDDAPDEVDCTGGAAVEVVEAVEGAVLAETLES